MEDIKAEFSEEQGEPSDPRTKFQEEWTSAGGEAAVKGPKTPEDDAGAMDAQNAGNEGQGDGEERETRTNLIVNYLPQAITDEAFRSLFTAIGDLTSAKVVREKATNYCFGYGFVNYRKPEHAATAIQKINGLRLLNKTLKVAYSRPNTGKTKNANLYISGLNPTSDEDDLKRLFGPYGTIVQAKTLTDYRTGKCSGTGFVLFSSSDECDKAIADLDGTSPAGIVQILNVRYAHNSGKKAQQAYEDYTFTTQQPVAQYGDPYNNGPSAAGPIRSGIRGPQMMQQMSMMGGKGSQGVVTDPTLADRNELGIILFVRNFKLDTDEEKLYSLFAAIGPVRKVNIMRDDNGQGKGFGFVTMAEDEDAVRAVLKLNRSTQDGRMIEVRFKLKPGGADVEGVPALRQPIAPMRQQQPMGDMYGGVGGYDDPRAMNTMSMQDPRLNSQPYPLMSARGRGMPHQQGYVPRGVEMPQQRRNIQTEPQFFNSDASLPAPVRRQKALSRPYQDMGGRDMVYEYGHDAYH